MRGKSNIAAKGGYHHGDLGAALVAAVRRLIERDGPSNFSISEACKMAGVSTAAPYRHFADKQDILYHVAQAGFVDMTAMMVHARDAEPADSSQVRRIARMGKAYLRFAFNNPGTFRLMFGSSPNVKENKNVHETGHTCFGTLINEVGRYMGPKTEEVEIKRVAVRLWTFVHGAASLAIDKDYDAAEIDVNVEGMIDEATAMLLGNAAGPSGSAGIHSGNDV
ncbi:MAG: TetR/AcrR family transcriptional regulator [Pseudomonadota bacterium]